MDKKSKKETIKVEYMRIAGNDIPTNSTLAYGFSKIKGISHMFSNVLCVVLKLDKNKKIKDLSDKEIDIIEDFLENPKKKGIPTWLLNNQKEYVSGEDMHVVSKNLDYFNIQVKRRIMKLKNYKGLRTRLKLPVRGQRTASNFRKNKTIASIKAKSINSKKK